MCSDEQCDIRIRLKEVARYQARLDIEAGHVWLTSVSRSNPTHLNFKPMEMHTPMCLMHGDVFIIAGRQFRLEYRE